MSDHLLLFSGRLITSPISVASLLIASIRISILQGAIYEKIARDFGTALERYTRAYTIIGLARSKWRGHNGTPNSLRRTFCKCINFMLMEVLVDNLFAQGRGVTARILQCRVQLCRNHNYQAADLVQIEKLAQNLLTLCEKHPIPRPDHDGDPSQFTTWMSFDTSLRAEVGVLVLSRIFSVFQPTFTH